MKTNCPHCQGEIIIETQCCIGDQAVSGIYLPEKYAAKLQIDNQKEAEKKRKQAEYESALKEFTTEYCKDRSLIKNKLGFKIICFGLTLLLAITFTVFYHNNDASSYRELIYFCIYLTLALIVLGAFLAMLEDLRKDSISKIFLKNHPKFADIFKTE